jgi:hypothetical protein
MSVLGGASLECGEHRRFSSFISVLKSKSQSGDARRTPKGRTAHFFRTP